MRGWLGAGETTLRHPAFYIGHHVTGEPVQIEVPEGIALPMFGDKKKAEEWMLSMMEPAWRHRVSVRSLRTLESVERFYERYSENYDLLTLNPPAQSNGTVYLHPLEKMLEIAESEAAK